MNKEKRIYIFVLIGLSVFMLFNIMKQYKQFKFHTYTDINNLTLYAYHEDGLTISYVKIDNQNETTYLGGGQVTFDESYFEDMIDKVSMDIMIEDETYQTISIPPLTSYKANQSITFDVLAVDHHIEPSKVSINLTIDYKNNEDKTIPVTLEKQSATLYKGQNKDFMLDGVYVSNQYISLGKLSHIDGTDIAKTYPTLSIEYRYKTDNEYLTFKKISDDTTNILDTYFNQDYYLAIEGIDLNKEDLDVVITLSGDSETTFLLTLEKDTR